MDCNQVFDRVLPDQPDHRVTPGFAFPYFFLKPGLVPSPGQAGFQNYGFESVSRVALSVVRIIF